jgi:hypothetical protein
MYDTRYQDESSCYKSKANYRNSPPPPHTHTHTHTLELYTSKTNYLIYVYQNKEKQLFEPCDIILSIPDKRRMNHYLYNNIVLSQSIHFRQISFFKITKDIQSNNNNNIVMSMLYAEICPKVRRHNALPFFGSCIMPSNLGTYSGI